MLAYVTIKHVDACSAGREISEEEGNNSLTPSSSSVAGRLKQLNLNMQTQSVCSRSEISCVINSRLDLVITPQRAVQARK
jgi:hypothetical protein